MLDIRTNASVSCVDGHAGDAGHVQAFILDPVKKEVTHLVVGKHEFDGSSLRLVHIDVVKDAVQDQVQLSCTLAELAAMDPFVETRYLGPDEIDPYIPDYVSMETGQYMSPYTIDMYPAGMDVGVEAVPHGELAIHRGASVEATDGKIGHVGEFVVQPESGHITHVVLQKGHLWRKKEIAVPISHIKQVLDDVVHLDLDKDAVEALPEPSLARSYGDALR